MKFRIASGVTEQLLSAAATAAPEECCGLLLGRDNHIEAAVPAANVAADRTRSFEIDPAVLLRTHREARGQGQQVIGHYHSHPNGSTQPSKRDAARASDNGQLWLIIADSRLTAWQAGAETADALHGRFHPVTLDPA
jgi:proteasome lid subunit RPN8/RPN11